MTKVNDIDSNIDINQLNFMKKDVIKEVENISVINEFLSDMVIIDYSKENDPNKEIKTTSENDYGFQDITYEGEQTHVLVPESKQETKNETISTKVPESKQETKIEKGNELEENKPNITNYIEPSIDLENLMDILDNFENIEPNNDLNLNNMDIKKDNIEINMISGTDQPQLKQFSDTHWVSESNNEDWFGDSKKHRRGRHS